MNNKGNIMINFFFFILAVGIVVAFISPMLSFVSIAQQSDNMNCKGYLHDGLNESNSAFAFNTTKNGGESGSQLGCIAIRLYVPYLLMVVLVVGVSQILANRANDYFGGS